MATTHAWDTRTHNGAGRGASRATGRRASIYKRARNQPVCNLLVGHSAMPACLPIVGRSVLLSPYSPNSNRVTEHPGSGASVSDLLGSCDVDGRQSLNQPFHLHLSISFDPPANCSHLIKVKIKHAWPWPVSCGVSTTSLRP